MLFRSKGKKLKENDRSVSREKEKNESVCERKGKKLKENDKSVSRERGKNENASGKLKANGMSVSSICSLNTNGGVRKSMINEGGS